MKVLYFSSKSPPPILKSALGISTGALANYSPQFFLSLAKKTFMNPNSKREYKFSKLSPKTYEVKAKEGKVQLYHFAGGEKHIVLTHGWADTTRSFETIIESLLSEGFSVWAFDHYGHGFSQGKSANLFTFIDGLENTLKFIEAQGDHVAGVVSHSMGGAAILNLDEGVLKNKKVILMAPPTLFFEEMFNTFARVGIAEKTVKTLLNQFSHLYNKDWNTLRPMNNRHKIHENFLFIHDKEDIYCSYTNMLGLIKDTPAELITTEGLGHRKILRDKNILNQINNFLSQ